MQPDAPETEVELQRLPFNLQEHDWKQQGYEIACMAGPTGCPFRHTHGHRIPVGMQLVGSRGNWELKPEGGQAKQQA